LTTLAEYQNEMIAESIGECINCGEIKRLGNGLCKRCWDKDTNKSLETKNMYRSKNEKS